MCLVYYLQGKEGCEKTKPPSEMPDIFYKCTTKSPSKFVAYLQLCVSQECVKTRIFVNLTFYGIVGEATGKNVMMAMRFRFQLYLYFYVSSFTTPTVFKECIFLLQLKLGLHHSNPTLQSCDIWVRIFDHWAAGLFVSRTDLSVCGKTYTITYLTLSLKSSVDSVLCPHLREVGWTYYWARTQNSTRLQHLIFHVSNYSPQPYIVCHHI